MNMWYQRLEKRYNLSLHHVLLSLMTSNDMQQLLTLEHPFMINNEQPGEEVLNPRFGKNIAKGTTDPMVEFISQDHSSQFTNLEHITISESH